uniref:Uncharacterized protein n=1 Tax=Cacopsylla melanoneura TaxID=428564 RepID=A0A8D8WBM2_9HEMI
MILMSHLCYSSTNLRSWQLSTAPTSSPYSTKLNRSSNSTCVSPNPGPISSSLPTQLRLILTTLPLSILNPRLGHRRESLSCTRALTRHPVERRFWTSKPKYQCSISTRMM